VRFAAGLLAWFEKNRRRFPWRARPRSAYRIAVAEALLQKTSATNALPIYKRLIRKYPTVGSLAAADLRTLRALLRPLGLPRRSRLLRDLAVEIVSKHHSRFPRTEAELRMLPGVGPYGASAIASQALGSQVPMIDVNVMRIFHRVFTMPYTPRSGPSRRLRELVAEVLPPEEASDFNLALIDFGALICSSRNPRHDICPIAELCDYWLVRQGKPRKARVYGQEASPKSGS
jgi:A/G-specific adenine glycosylase